MADMFLKGDIYYPNDVAFKPGNAKESLQRAYEAMYLHRYDSSKCSACGRSIVNDWSSQFDIPILNNENSQIEHKGVILCKRCAERLARCYRSLEKSAI